jgi:hypothetical protein
MDDKAAWLKRVLGVSVPGQGAAATTTGPGSALEVWRDAKARVDDGISQLQAACRSNKDPSLTAVLKDVADKGLNGVTNRASVGMMAAMLEAGSSPAARDKVTKAVADFRDFLAKPIAAMIDENPFGVSVGLRSTMAAALDKIDAMLAA